MTLGYLDIKELISNQNIKSSGELLPQPSSLDVPLTQEIYRMPCSILPKRTESIRNLVEEKSLYKVSSSALLELGHYYLVKADMSLKLPENTSGTANNKSSMGRTNLQCRMVLDGVPLFDTIPNGYTGEVWVEIHPELAPISLKGNLPAINQIRLREGLTLLEKDEIPKYHKNSPLLYHPSGNPLLEEELEIGNDQRSLNIGVRLDNPQTRGWKGIRRPHTPILLHERKNPSNLFFQKISEEEENLIMLQNEFFILGSLQQISNPLDVCITMRPFQAEHGEFRSHFAGFFDPGNGYGKNGEEKGFTVTMEVIPLETAIEVRHGQLMFGIEIEKLKQPCPAEMAYGAKTGSHYHCDQGPKLARWFY